MTEMSAKALKELESQLEATLFRRDRTLKKIDKVYDLSLSLTIESADFESFKTRSSSIHELLKEFNDYQTDIIRLKSRLGKTDHKVEAELSDSVSDKYYHVLTVISKSCPPTSPKPELKDSSSHSQAKLPKISLPTFSGSFKEWPTFYDLFRQLVHENKSLSNIEKFMYLIGSCTNDALRLAKNLPITDVNYVITWQSFITRYQDKRKLASCYLDEIQKISPVSSKSIKSLRNFIDVLSENSSALRTLGLPVDQWSFILLHLVICKVDQKLRTDFELKHSESELPTFDQFLSFLNEQCKALECTQPTSELFVKSEKPSHQVKQPSSSQLYPKKAFVSNFVGVKCLFCNEAHTIYKCKNFELQTPAQRREFIRARKACFNCLRSSHMLNECTSKTNCLTCGARHNTLLHDESKSDKPGAFKVRLGQDSQVSPVPNEDAKDIVDKSKSNVGLQSFSSSVVQKSTMVLLGTAVINIKDKFGEYQPIRALIDSGSQTSFITEECCQRLKLPRNKTFENICGIADTPVLSTKGIVSIYIKPRFSNEPNLQTDAIVLPRIAPAMPPTPLPVNIKSNYRELNLADPSFDTPGKIDFLLGADLYSEVLHGGRLPAPSGYPVPHNSIFGWVLMGPVNVNDKTLPAIVSNFVSVGNLDVQLRKFWELEELPNHIVKNPEDEACEELFRNSVRRNEDGRFIVSLPFKDKKPSLGDSYSYASSCFKNLERKLCKQQNIRHEYSKFINEYHELGHMELVPNEKTSEIKCYLPHHPVIKESSSTTKLRVVFNASAKTSNGKSLNDNLLVGPKLQKNISDIILNFRMHNIVFTADICKMYRQILLSEEHQPFQAILWRDSPSEPLKTFMLKTVTYGVSSAPFLAIRTLQQLASEEREKYPLAAKVLMNDIYVDDIVSGSHSLESALTVRNELIEILNNGCFQLRKWSSNKAEFLSDIPIEDQEVPLRFDGDDKQTIKVLGIQWESKQDIFTFHVGTQYLESTSFTKRGVLSCLSRIFDPLGYVSPVVFWAKHFMQQLWTLGLNWDDPLPDKFHQRWKDYIHQLPELEKLSLPRLIHHSSSSCELHGFCDAAESGYCGVVYLRMKTESGDIHSQLVMAKTKVSPLKRISIPKLELCGAHLLSKMISLLHTFFSNHFVQINIFAWCDSLTVISWIKTSPHLLKTFVANRVSEIQQAVTPSTWKYVSSADNPADCGSRGIFPVQILSHATWWNGPSWLSQQESNWPEQPVLQSETLDLPELKNSSFPSDFQTSLTATKKSDSLEFIERFSSLTRLQRIGAWCLRFIANCRKGKTDRIYSNLTLPELNDCLLKFVKQTQEHYFKEEIKLLKLGQPCSNKLKRLDPFVDEKGILRVGGRIRHSSLRYERKHPALLPKCSHLTVLVIEHYHCMHLHAGPQVTQAAIQRSFWILSGRCVIRQQIHKCLKCFKFRQSLPKPFMADLPAVRLQQNRAFINCGVDFAGPFTTKSDRLRKPQLLKSYLCLFICLATRAVHLEVASGLSTDNFLAAFHRFIARRGMCATLTSDRGTNFIGAHNQLEEYHRLLATEPNSSRITDQLANKGIKWQFNPPHSPHFGGIWEANIKSAKSILKKVIGEQVLTFEELTTLFSQIEAVMNSRPICALSSDPNELSALTPGHFVIGDALTTVPEPSLMDLNLSRLSRWQMIQRAKQHFWNRWYHEYIHTLQQRQKWNDRGPEAVKAGDLVLIKEDNLPPLRWSLGRVIEVHPGRDQITRVVTLRTSSGTCTRPVVKLCPLPPS